MHHVGILYGQFMMHGQRNIKLLYNLPDTSRNLFLVGRIAEDTSTVPYADSLGEIMEEELVVRITV